MAKKSILSEAKETVVEAANAGVACRKAGCYRRDLPQLGRRRRGMWRYRGRIGKTRHRRELNHNGTLMHRKTFYNYTEPKGATPKLKRGQRGWKGASTLLELWERIILEWAFIIISQACSYRHKTSFRKAGNPPSVWGQSRRRCREFTSLNVRNRPNCCDAAKRRDAARLSSHVCEGCVD